MKRVFALLLVLLTAGSLAACGKKNQSQTQEQPAPVPVLQAPAAPEQTQEDNSATEVINQGNLLIKKYCNEAGVVNKIETYHAAEQWTQVDIYDDDGILTETQLTEADGTCTVTVFFYNNETGRLEEEETYQGEEMVASAGYFYDDNGVLTKENRSEKDGSQVVITYNSGEMMETRDTVYADGTVVNETFTDTGVLRTKTTTDAGGNWTKEEHIYVDDTLMESRKNNSFGAGETTTYIRSEDGQELMAETYNTKEKFVSYVSLQYYDADENWLGYEYVTYDASGAPAGDSYSDFTESKKVEDLAAFEAKAAEYRK